MARHRLLPAIALLVGFGAVAPAAAAQWTVFDPTNFQENVLQYLRAADALAVSRQQLAAALLALRKLDAPQWRAITSLVSAGDAALGTDASLGYARAGLPSAFVATFPGAVPTRTAPADERAATARTMATLGGALDAQAAQGASLVDASRTLDQMRGQLAGVQGTEGALELAGTVHVFSAQELVLLRQAVLAQANVDAVYDAAQLDDRARTDESLRALATAMGAAPPRRPRWSLVP